MKHLNFAENFLRKQENTALERLLRRGHARRELNTVPSVDGGTLREDK